MNEFEKEIISIITNAGDCRAHCYKALDYADEGEYEEAEKEKNQLGTMDYDDFFYADRRHMWNFNDGIHR